MEDRLWLSKGVDLVSRRYFSVYQLMKSGPCNATTCDSEDCDLCSYGAMREQAAKDHDIIMSVSRFISKKCNRFKYRRPCYYEDTACEYKDFCVNVSPGRGPGYGND